MGNQHRPHRPSKHNSAQSALMAHMAEETLLLVHFSVQFDVWTRVRNACPKAGPDQKWINEASRVLVRLLATAYAVRTLPASPEGERAKLALLGLDALFDYDPAAPFSLRTPPCHTAGPVLLATPLLEKHLAIERRSSVEFNALSRVNHIRAMSGRSSTLPLAASSVRAEARRFAIL